MATTETPVAITATATEAVAQPDTTPIVPADKAVETPLAVTVEAPADSAVATEKPADETAIAEPATTTEEDVKPTEEAAAATAAAPSTEKDAAVREEKKTGFLTSLRKGLNVALVPKPSLDSATDAKNKKEEAQQAETIPETTGEDAVEGAEGIPSEPAPAATATDSTAPPPVRRTSFAAFKHRVSHGFGTPSASPSATPTKKGATNTTVALTASPPASPRKSTSAKLHELAESAADKAEETAAHIKHNIEAVAAKITEDSAKPEEGTTKAPGTAHKKVEPFKGLGKKLEEAFHKKPSASKPAATEAEAVATQESADAAPVVAEAADTEATTDKAPEAAADEDAEALNAAASKTEGEASQPAKSEKRFLGLKKRFSISVQSKGGDKSAATSGDEGKDAAVITKEASSAEPVVETAANDAAPSGSEPAIQDAPKETPPVAQRRTSIFSALVNGKSKTATSPAAVAKADPLETAVEAAATEEATTEAVPAEAAAPTTPEPAVKELESAPASPAKGSKKASGPSSFGLDKLNKMANKILDKGKDKANKNRLSVDSHQAKKDKEAEATPVTPTEQAEEKIEASVAATEAPVAAPALPVEAVAVPSIAIEGEDEAAKPAEVKVEEKAEEKVEAEPVAAAAAAEVAPVVEEKKE
ncbi:hypothetical protein BCV69DRAFT_300734 [Microstroma glucosiphilum]|uniref:Uncharacterized protein n=1 Tax=Pseudomicrostroma glucosiphilum TaxID=1684307 RepID=A0A316U2A3_9BASI|nr:hypothetical protein BCV69DRAFT_300734 [Pseudomicrostroma glucosiphilum]PWN18944.1 hypothetical protein BCV69DRAFT_300734 [Pseudomicrostroma glucosiphilum]